MSISLSKGEKVSLTKRDGSGLTNIRLGLGWDEVSATPVKKGLFGRLAASAAGGGGDIDLDASAITLNARREKVDIVYYGSKRSKDGSINHTGDNLTGAGEGDDESILVDLSRVPSDVTSIIFVITSYRGHTFDQIRNAFCRVLDASGRDEVEVARYDLSDVQGGYTAQIVASLIRGANGWEFAAIGEPTHGKTAHDLVNEVARFA